MSKSKSPLSRSEKSLYAVSAAAVSLFIGFALFNSSRNSDPQINFPTPVTRPKPNGYNFYVAAAKATVRFTPEHDPMSDTNMLTIGSPAYKQRYSLARRKAWMKVNGKMLALFQKAKQTPTMSYDMREDFSGNKGKFGILRQLARDNTSIARMYQMEHRPFAAAQTVLDGMQMGNGISKNGTVLNRLVGIAIIAISRSALEDFNVTINQLNASEAKTLATRLETIIANQPKFKDVLEEERWVSLRNFQRIMKQAGWRSFSSDPTMDVTWSQRLAAQIISKQQIVNNINRSFDEAITQCKLPYSQCKTFNLPDDLSKLFSLQPINGIRMNEARSNVGLDLLLLRLALRAYKVENGIYPASLSALAPKYLKTIPTDDYGDYNPYFYRLKNGNFELWSVGADGKNDNGKPLTRQNANPNFQVSDVFQEDGDFVAGKNR